MDFFLEQLVYCVIFHHQSRGSILKWRVWFIWIDLWLKLFLYLMIVCDSCSTKFCDEANALSEFDSSVNNLLIMSFLVV